jgi:F0F1-type ATP synthase assembly protein I
LRDSAPYLGIGSSLAFTVLLCLWVGHWLDEKFGTEPRYFLVGAVVGVAAAALHFWRMYKTMVGGKK